MKIPFNKPTTSSNTIRYMTDAIESNHVSGDGQYTKKCSKLLEEVLDAERVLLTTSGTHALEMAAMLARKCYPYNNAIMSTFTFPSTANAFLLSNITPVFVDIRQDTLNIDEGQAIDVLDGSSVVVPMHYAGIGCKMEAFTELDLPIIEDNAHGLFGKYQGQWLGTFGQTAALSFHETKNYTSGEGGALIINDPNLIERAEIIREKGTNRSKFYRGQIDKYTWVDKGSSYLPSDILAAYLWAQLERWQKARLARWMIWDKYASILNGWATANGVCLPCVPSDCQQAYHLFYMIMPDTQTRDRFIKYLASHDIQATFHYIPLHLSPMGEQLGYRTGQFPVAEDMASRLVRLPFYTDMTNAEQDYVIDKVRGFES